MALLRILNPKREVGKITLITRYGASKVRSLLPAHIKAVESSEYAHRVVWQCDPMHGNTRSTPNGVKTRRFGDIFSELQQSLEIHKEEGSYLGGVHLELTGDAVTECTGGSEGLDEDDLASNYTSYCDPRLNEKQALEMAFLIAGHYRGEASGKSWRKQQMNYDLSLIRRSGFVERPLTYGEPESGWKVAIECLCTVHTLEQWMAFQKSLISCLLRVWAIYRNMDRLAYPAGVCCLPKGGLNRSCMCNSTDHFLMDASQWASILVNSIIYRSSRPWVFISVWKYSDSITKRLHPSFSIRTLYFRRNSTLNTSSSASPYLIRYNGAPTIFLLYSFSRKSIGRFLEQSIYLSYHPTICTTILAS